MSGFDATIAVTHQDFILVGTMCRSTGVVGCAITKILFEVFQ
jgi:hypothetical protein